MPAFLQTHGQTILIALLCSVGYFSIGHEIARHDLISLVVLWGGLFILTHVLIKRSKSDFLWMLGIGILFRLLFIDSVPVLSQDFNRFIWDGHLVLNGYNPFVITPNEYIALTPEGTFWQELFNGMGALSTANSTSYPPLNQLFFTIGSALGGENILGSVITMRVMTIGADIGILFIGRKLLKSLSLDPNLIFWYFLNPFIIIELTGNLHFEGVMLFFFISSIYLLFKGRWAWAAVAMGLSVSVKLIPLLFLPLFYKYFVKNGIFGKGFGRMFLFYGIALGTVVISFLPFLDPAFISSFSSTIGLWFQEFEFNASIFYIIRWIGFETVGWDPIESVGKILAIIVLAVVLILSFYKRNQSLKELLLLMLMAISIYFALSTTVHPWYIATPVLLCLFTKYRFPIVWSFMLVLTYSAYGAEGFKENLWLVALEYAVVLIYFLWELRRQNRKYSSDDEAPSLQHAE